MSNLVDQGDEEMIRKLLRIVQSDIETSPQAVDQRLRTRKYRIDEQTFYDCCQKAIQRLPSAHLEAIIPKFGEVTFHMRSPWGRVLDATLIVGQTEGHVTVDMCLAARELLPPIGSWIGDWGACARAIERIGQVIDTEVRLVTTR